jgi:hypothetical protein
MKTKNCGIGTRCGGTCIYRDDDCRAKFSADASKSTSQIKAQVMKIAKESHVDAQIGVVSTVAAGFGASVGGPIGAKVAELAASLAVRKGNQDFVATKRAYDRVKVKERYQTAGRIDKARLVLQEAVVELGTNRRERKKEMINEGVGFFMGNLGAFAPVPLPMKGMVTAMVTTPKIMTIVDPFIK